MTNPESMSGDELLSEVYELRAEVERLREGLAIEVGMKVKFRQDRDAALASAADAPQPEEREVTGRAAEGLESRYTVTKNGDTTGKHTECKFFVLDLTHDPISRRALMTYSQAARLDGLTALAADLVEMLRELPDPWPAPQPEES